MNLHLLRVFLTVVEQQGFSRAAETLFVSQSAVSKAVRELEHQLDLPLIERTGSDGKAVRDGTGGIALTDHGRAVFEHARAIFALERIAIEDVRDRVELRQGRLRIGASTTVAAYWLPQQLGPFVRRHPALTTELVVGNTEEISRAVIDCAVDVGFVEGAVADARIAATVWRSEPLRLIASADNPLGAKRRASIAELGRQTWLLREHGSGTRQVAQSLFAARGIAPARVIEIGSNEAIARAVAAGAGIALLPSTVVADLILMQRVRAIALSDEDTLTRPLYRLELVNRPRSPALQAFLDEED
ncbi:MULTISPECIES: LysR substrate-binding domain-containing protein [unclassified Lysobacter]|uniref:LysR substrate-binding domain-containing protein n=1 Tax=unclassified Lysobacter TaxID=2635362 RepID=UPI001BE99B0F|nr:MULTISPECIES: LysR substrate-binding domain-containing protein [unclassified Lysobacter]MBT2745663.1 LysR family transcriptional regulator [Lysobacter sp. ISL-42]MBT2749778.1 LysR family transcriptional regulator [Lysobacter sp. ISL-50]MBT2777503.1 LysR family transcriptional regulator [Lysobacter sp. ISL-54]MBT2781991.1 LysR family transcriptional regulator [Lysobacter sp. ISL-52]